MSGAMAWMDRLDADTARAITDLLGRAAAADDVAPISEQAMLSMTLRSSITPRSSTTPGAALASGMSPASEEPTVARHLLAMRGDSIVGYANFVAAHGEHPAMAEVVVDPPHRGRGVGAELTTRALGAGGPGTRVWAHGDLPAARAVATRLGLRAARELWQMRRSLATPELPELVVPHDIVVRTYAGPADDAELLRVNRAAFAWHPEQGGWTERDIAIRRAESWFDPAGLFLAFAETAPDRLLGFHWTKMHLMENPPIGEVYVVGLDPVAQGRGLGRVLTVAGLRHLRDRGLTEVSLYTEADNVAAVRTYTGLGFAPAHVDVAYAVAECE
ncbi:mycothiol synthase [Nocardia sp. CNY236]|uniref:mycothiol synthase n=1 Tax=Nocardia sp. CNY236 TaxID=1169152 RepID=UPI000400D9B7|nr:mycothiol synthase [Nocardia sp. CNY236]